MKKLIYGICAGLVLGTSGCLALGQIPSVNARLFPNLKNNSSFEESSKVSELQDENLGLKQNITNLNSELTTAKTQLTEKDNKIKEHEQTITQLNTDKSSLQSEIDRLTAENESYKELVGSDSADLLETISSLSSQLNEKTTQLNSAIAELEQLKVDKQSLETRVQELESSIKTLEEELANYKSLDEIDMLNVASYEGKWYLDGEFKDYYIIQNGVATHNANEDTGVIQVLNNQMYLFMNNTGSLPVTLSADGNSFTTQDGSIYKKFYINTTETVVANAIDYVGDYSYSNENISLNGDNTLSYTIGEVTYYGAYTVSAISKNVGGNTCITNTISATINIGDTQENRTYEIVTGSGVLVDTESNVNYNFVSSPIVATLSSSSTLQYSVPSADYMKVRVRTDRPIFINARESVNVVTIASGSYACTINGKSLGSSSSQYVRNFTYPLFNASDENVFCNYFDFYFSGNTQSYTYFDTFVSVDGVDCSIVSVEFSDDTIYDNVGRLRSCCTYSGSRVCEIYLRQKLFSLNNYITCSIVEDYVNATYTMSDGNIQITSDGVTITPTDGESITATSYSVTAKTDGYDIYQTATIVYSTTDGDTTTSHTIVIEYKNNNIVSSTLDGVETTITKN